MVVLRARWTLIRRLVDVVPTLDASAGLVVGGLGFRTSAATAADGAVPSQCGGGPHRAPIIGKSDPGPSTDQAASRWNWNSVCSAGWRGMRRLTNARVLAGAGLSSPAVELIHALTCAVRWSRQRCGCSTRLARGVRRAITLRQAMPDPGHRQPLGGAGDTHVGEAPLNRLLQPPRRSPTPLARAGPLVDADGPLNPARRPLSVPGPRVWRRRPADGPASRLREPCRAVVGPAH